MKQLWIGVLGAVIGGFILFIMQGAYQNWANSQQYSVEVTQGPDAISIDEESVKKFSETLDKGGLEIRVVPVTISNNGSMDISNKTFTAQVGSFVGFRNIETPNNNQNNVSISYKNDTMYVKYKILPAGSEHKFWFAVNSVRYGSFDKFYADDPGVSVTNKPDLFDVKFPWFWFGMIGIGIIIFILGVTTQAAILRGELANRGYDLNEILKAPKTTS